MSHATSHQSRSPRLAAAVAAALALAGVLAGCESTGLSPREGVSGGGNGNNDLRPNYANYVYSLYTSADMDAGRPARPVLAKPARIAVAQVGEVAPPNGMLELLRKDSTLIAAAVPVPGNVDAEARPYPDTRPPRDAEGLTPAERQARDHVARMRRYAADMGMNYLFLFGGTIDHGSTSTGLSLMDLTVVGAFVVPSKAIEATGRAAGTLIEVDSGRVVLAVTAEAKDHDLASSVGREGHEAKLLEDLRADLTKKLAEQLVERMKTP